MTTLKLALFSFICAIALAIAAVITGVLPITILAFASALVCIGSLVTWVCIKILKRFKHSVNIISIVIFFVLAVVSYLLLDVQIYVETLSDIASLDYISIAWIASAFACCVSILVLIGRLIFEKKDTPAPPSSQTISNTGEYNPYNHEQK